MAGICLGFHARAQAASDNVLSANIKEADGTSGQNTNSGAGVKTGHIQDGAVTDAKISGVISATKLPIGLTAGTVSEGDHGHDTVYQKKYANVLVVAKSGGDFTDPVAAVSSVADASSSNPYLVKIMPGIYDIGSGVLMMKPFVDVEGAGENVTVITGSVSSEGAPLIGTVHMEDNTQLRSLSVRNVATGFRGVAISAAFRELWLTHITAQASGAQESYGIWATGSELTINNVTAAASGNDFSYGIFLNGCGQASTPGTMSNVTATASGSTYNNEAVRIEFSSPTMSNVSASAFGISPSTTSMSIGIHNLGSSPYMNNVTANGTGGSLSVGIRNIYESSPILDGVTATGSGAGTNYGIEFYGYYVPTSPVMRNVAARGLNGPWNSGLVISGAPVSLLIDRCTLEGSTGSIEIYNTHDLKIGASKLGGSIFGGGGAVTCVASYNGSYAPLDTNCQ